jgi:hypothetical protein
MPGFASLISIPKGVVAILGTESSFLVIASVNKPLVASVAFPQPVIPFHFENATKSPCRELPESFRNDVALWNTGLQSYF